MATSIKSKRTSIRSKRAFSRSTTPSSIRSPFPSPYISSPLLPPQSPTKMENGQDLPTLFINAEDLLILSEWDPHYGTRYIRRPGFDKLLMYLAQFFEVVLIYPTLEFNQCSDALGIDPHRSIRGEINAGSLDRDHGTRYLDLQRVPRDPQRVIVMAKDPAFCKQVEPRGGGEE